MLCNIIHVISILEILEMFEIINFDIVLGPYFILLAYIPAALSGGFPVFHLALNSYMTETTPSKLRALRFMTLELFLFVGKSNIR